MIARHVTADGTEAERVARQLVAGLAGDGRGKLALVIVCADWRIDPGRLARTMQAALPAPVVGCTTIGVVGAPAGTTAMAMGFYGDWLRVGVGVAPELPSTAIARSRDAVHQAARALGLTPDKLDPSRHVAITLVDGTCGHEEAFCIGSAATAPQIRFVGGAAGTEVPSERRAFVWANGEALADAGIVVLFESKLPFQVVTSSHVKPTAVRTVVTAASGRSVHELDGRPALPRLVELVEKLGGKLDPERPLFSFARFVDGVPYVRSIKAVSGTSLELASAVEVGHVLRLMQPTDLIGVTRADLARAAEGVGGKMAALLAFSCVGRHWEAASRGLAPALDEVYARYPTVGFQSFGEHTGMLLVNHTLTALAIGGGRG